MNPLLFAQYLRAGTLAACNLAALGGWLYLELQGQQPSNALAAFAGGLLAHAGAAVLLGQQQQQPPSQGTSA